eukprot:1147893-Rhodomonas_salina.2
MSVLNLEHVCTRGADGGTGARICYRPHWRTVLPLRRSGHASEQRANARARTHPYAPPPQRSHLPYYPTPCPALSRTETGEIATPAEATCGTEEGYAATGCLELRKGMGLQDVWY